MTENGSAKDLEGELLGPYRLLRQLREGGYSVLFLAEQTAPLSRHVAIKTVKRGMETRSVIRRMESEAQILAQMIHPGIPSLLGQASRQTAVPTFQCNSSRGPRSMNTATRTESDCAHASACFRRSAESFTMSIKAASFLSGRFAKKRVSPVGIAWPSFFRC